MSEELAAPEGIDLALLERAAEYLRAASSPATRRAYAGQWRRFVTWCEAQGAEPLPASGPTLALYLADSAEQLKPASLEVALSAISAAHRAAGYESPRTDPRVRRMRQGIRRTHATAAHQKAPLGAEQLRAIVGALPSSAGGIRNRALLVLGWLGALRPSEIGALDLADVREVTGGLEMTLRWSKRDQEGLGLVKALPRGKGAICPVHVWRAWLEVRADAPPAAPRDPLALFWGVTRWGSSTGYRLTRRDVARLLKRVAGVGDFSGHSLRAGFVTTAYASGRSERSIQQQTGHTSIASLRKYIRLATLFEDNAATGLL